jgi:hypothetical protein
MAGESNPQVSAPSDVESLHAYGEPTAPTAGTALATLTTPPAGTYRVVCEVCFVGSAPAAAEDGNVEIRKAAVVQKRLATGRAQNVIYPGEAIVTVDGTQNISANANANATASVLYVTSLTATRIRSS